MSEIKIGALSAAAGEKTRGNYRVPGTGYHFPVTIINGKAEGKTLLLTSGIHACEYVGIRSAIELTDELMPQDITGAVVIVHPVNTSGFQAITPAVIPESKENLNRLFPGEREGTLGQKIAYALTYEFQAITDFYIDMHGGDLCEQLVPFVFYPGAAAETVTAEARRIAAVLGVGYMLKSSALTGAYHSAAVRGLPSLLIERGGCGLWDAGQVAQYKQDIYAAMSALEMWKTPVRMNVREPQEVTAVRYLESTAEGCWSSFVDAGDFVQKGDLLGEIRTFFNEKLVSFKAEIDGVVLYRASSLSVKKGTELVAYATPK